METSTKIAIGAGVVITIGITLYLTKDKWLPLLQGEKEAPDTATALTRAQTASRGLGGAAKFDFGNKDKYKKTSTALADIGKSIYEAAQKDKAAADKLKSMSDSSRAVHSTKPANTIEEILVRVNKALSTGSAPTKSTEFKRAMKRLMDNGYELKNGKMVKTA